MLYSVTNKQSNDWLPEEDDAHAGDGGRGSTAQVVGLKQEVDVWAELNALTAWHCQQTVVI